MTDLFYLELLIIRDQPARDERCRLCPHCELLGDNFD
jgi:hypothetical protein